MVGVFEDSRKENTGRGVREEREVLGIAEKGRTLYPPKSKKNNNKNGALRNR